MKELFPTRVSQWTSKNKQTNREKERRWERKEDRESEHKRGKIRIIEKDKLGKKKSKIGKCVTEKERKRERER